MPWIAVHEPFSAAARVTAPSVEEVFDGDASIEYGRLSLKELSVDREVDLSCCVELLISDSALLGVNLQSEGITLDARWSSFEKCDLSGLMSKSIHGSRISTSKLMGNDFSSAKLDDVVFEGCVLRYVNFRSAKLNRVHFVDCTLLDVDFSEAELSDVGFTGSSLEEVSVHQVRGNRVDLRGAETIRLSSVGKLEGFLATKGQLQELIFDLAFAAGLGVANV